MAAQAPEAVCLVASTYTVAGFGFNPEGRGVLELRAPGHDLFLYVHKSAVPELAGALGPVERGPARGRLELADYEPPRGRYHGGPVSLTSDRVLAIMAKAGLRAIAAA